VTISYQVNKQKVFFPNLDAIRFFAFALVFLQHGFGNILNFYDIKNLYINRITTFLLLGGGLGVSVFFVLSGFLITYLILTEIETRGKLDVKAFYIRRTLRIWPLYFCVVLFAFYLYPYIKSLIHIESDLCSRAIYYLLFLANFEVIHINKVCPGHDSMVENIVWSVAIEEQFYLVWPLFFLLLSKKYYKYIFLSVIAISLVFRFFNLNDGPVLYFHTLSVCADLAIGGLGAYLAFYSKPFKNFFEELKPLTIFTIYVLGFMYCIFGVNLGVITQVFGRLVMTLFFAFIILEQCFNKSSSYKFGRLKLISKAGKYTYGYYLLHTIGILIVNNLFRLYGINLLSPSIILVKGFMALLITFIISYFSYQYFESYFIKMKTKFSFITKD